MRVPALETALLGCHPKMLTYMYMYMYLYIYIYVRIERTQEHLAPRDSRPG